VYGVTPVSTNTRRYRTRRFDAVFFLINTIAVVCGVYLFIVHDEPQWIPVLVIEYAWAFDNMRHNRP
jgi:hypothetical protein